MMTVTTPHTGCALLEVNQAQKEITANTAFLTLDALLNTGAHSKDFTAPPVSPADGDIYIIPVSAQGDWVGQDRNIAWYHDNLGWNFIAPNEGMTLWVNDKDALYSFNGTEWAPSVDNSATPLLGVNAIADTTNKLSVTSPAVLFHAETDDVQLKLNKQTTADSASVVFQRGFSGRAEFGITGDDDFHMKVSPDGTAFHESLIIDKNNGRVDIMNGLSFDSGAHILRHYEKGTWTPALGANRIGDYAGATGITVDNASYTRVGDHVHCYCAFTVDGVTETTFSVDSALSISGLPFAPNNISPSAIDFGGVSGFVYRSIGSAVNNLVAGGVGSSGSQFHMFVFRGLGANAKNTDMIFLHINYYT